MALGQTCRLLYAAVQHGAAWRSAAAPLKNSVYVRLGEPGFEFAAPKATLSSYGARFVPPPVLSLLRRRRTRRIALLGPNLNAEAGHLRALGCELPQLTHIVLVRAEVAAQALAQLALTCPRLRGLHLVSVEVRGQGQAGPIAHFVAATAPGALTPPPPHPPSFQNMGCVDGLPCLETLVVEDCNPGTHYHLLALLQDDARLPALRRIAFRGGEPPCLAADFASLRRGGAALEVTVGASQHVWARSYAMWERRTALRDVADFPALQPRSSAATAPAPVIPTCAASALRMLGDGNGDAAAEAAARRPRWGDQEW